jgi:endonuclease YncB( thermonuclease family)
MSAVAALVLCAAVTVHDGDTFRCDGEKIRIANIDAPELPDSPKCRDARKERAWCDYQAGYASRDALTALLRSGPVKVQRQGTDRYGRTLATVTVNGRDAGRYLIDLGLAQPWR